MVSRVVLALIGGLSAVALALAPSAGASTGPAGGRVYTLLATSESRSGPGLLRGSIALVAAGSDGTLVVGDYDGRLWRLRPRVARPARVAPPLGGSPCSVLPPCVTAIAAAPDDSVVAAVSGGIVRVRPSGTISRLPMAPPLSDVPALAVARDGTILVVDNRYGLSSRILRLAPDGQVVSTVDWTSSAVSRFVDVAPLPGGGFAAVADGRIWPFAADGTTPGPWRGQVKDIDAAPDGTLVEAGFSVVRRRAPDGRVLKRLGGAFERSSNLLDYDGLAAGAYPLQDSTEAVAALPHGGIAVLYSGSFEPGNRVVYAAPARPQRLAVALMPLSGHASAAGYVATVRSTRPALARLTVLSPAGRAVATARVPAGVGRVTLHRALAPGPYVLRVDVVGRDGQRATDYAGAVLGGVLPARYAVSLTEPSGDCGSNCEQDVEYAAQRRYGPHRVDVAWLVNTRCRVIAVRLGRNGLVRQGDYDCAGPGVRAFGASPRQPDRWDLTDPPQGP